MVFMESRAPLRKITLCGGCETASSKASDGYSIRPLRDDQLESFNLQVSAQAQTWSNSHFVF